MSDTIKPFCIIAHPRSGTGYTAACFRAVGLDVGHERMRRHGIASWQWAVPARIPVWGDPRGGQSLSNYTVVYVMRDPRETSASVMHTERSSESWRASWVFIPLNAPPFERAVMSILNWHRLCIAQADIVVTLPRVPALAGMLMERSPPAVPLMNMRPHPARTEDDLDCLSDIGHEAWQLLLAEYDLLDHQCERITA